MIFLPILTMGAFAVGCGSDPLSSWRTDEVESSFTPEDVAADALLGGVWEQVDLSDHSTTRTTFAFERDEMLVERDHWDLFLEEQEPLARFAGSWAINGGEVTMQWDGGSPRTITNTVVVVPPELVAEMDPRLSDGTYWPRGGYLATDGTGLHFHSSSRETRMGSTGIVIVEGGVAVDLTFNRPLTQLLDGGECLMTMEVTVSRDDQDGRLTIHEPCIARRVGVAAEVLPLVLDQDDGTLLWQTLLEGAAAEEVELTSSIINAIDPDLWFMPATPHMLTPNRLWNAFRLKTDDAQ